MHGNKTGKEQTHEGCRGQTTQAKLLLFELGLKKIIVAEFVVFFTAQVHVLRVWQVSADIAARPFSAGTVGVPVKLSGALDASGRV